MAFSMPSFRAENLWQRPPAVMVHCYEETEPVEFGVGRPKGPFTPDLQGQLDIEKMREEVQRIRSEEKERFRKMLEADDLRKNIHPVPHKDFPWQPRGGIPSGARRRWRPNGCSACFR